MHDFNPDLPIFDEAVALAKLGRASDPLFVRALREMAHKGESLRKRFENSCNYAWASGKTYEAGSLVIAKAIYGLARDAGLRCYLQTDPRGATVYVANEPLDDQNYSSAVCLFYGDDE
jgi:hypothetical protein